MMDPAVAIVQAYLRVNGYFTVTEYPLFESRMKGPEVRTVTDLDLLAYRLPQMGRSTKGVVVREGAVRGLARVDPELGSDPSRADMILAEVKEGIPRFNESTLQPRVLGAGLARFGCCLPEHAEALARALLRRGSAVTGQGHTIRIIAFGSSDRDSGSHPYHVVSLGHVVGFLEDLMKKDWEVVRQVQILEPGLGFLQMLMKARTGG